MAMRALAILLALMPVCVMSKPWQFVPIRDYVEFDPVLNLSCSWQTPACQDCGIRVVAKFKGEAAVVAEDEVEPEDHPRRKKPVCFRMKLEAGEQFHLETKGHVFRVKKADACCLRQASFNQDGTEVPSIVSFTPTSSRKSKRFRFCLCEGVDPLKPETFCARITEEDYVCPISEYTANHTYGACANTSEVENVPEGCVTVDPPAEPALAPYWDALDNVSADRACRHTTPYDLSESYYGKHFCTETLEDCKAHCENTVGCKGVEFTPSQGRCEVWFADINATYPLFNVTCLRYHRRAQEAQDISFTPSSGVAGACRGFSSSDNSVCYYSVHNNGPKVPKLTLEECKQRCRSQMGCTGIEYKEDAGYCEAWKVPIEATASVSGYKCWQVAESDPEFLEPEMYEIHP